MPLQKAVSYKLAGCAKRIKRGIALHRQSKTLFKLGLMHQHRR